MWLQSLLLVCYFPIMRVQLESLLLSSDSSLLQCSDSWDLGSQRNSLTTNPVLASTLTPAHFWVSHDLRRNSGFTLSLISRKLSPAITAHTNISLLYLLQYLASTTIIRVKHCSTWSPLLYVVQWFLPYIPTSLLRWALSSMITSIVSIDSSRKSLIY